MTKHLLVRHVVENYETWKPHFDAHKGTRKKYGLTDLHVLRDSANQNDIILLFEVKDIAKAKEFAKSTELKTIMKKAGVLTKPELTFFTKEAK